MCKRTSFVTVKVLSVIICLLLLLTLIRTAEAVTLYSSKLVQGVTCVTPPNSPQSVSASCDTNRRQLDFPVPADFVVKNQSVFVDIDVELDWPPDAQGRNCREISRPDGGTAAIACVSTVVDFATQIFPVSSDTPEKAVEFLLAGHRCFSDDITDIKPAVDLNIQVKGGVFDGQVLPLKGAALRCVNNPPPFPSGSNFIDLRVSLIFDLGTTIQFGDPRHEFMEIHIEVEAEYFSDGTIPVQDLFDGLSPQGYADSIINTIISTLALSGMVPEKLFLYDFSGRYTITPDTFCYTNQFDAGATPPGLPTSASTINGQHPAGGNACGSSALKMALDIIGSTPSPLTTQVAYDNSMEQGLQVPPNTNQAFLWHRAYEWVLGYQQYDSKKLYNPVIRVPAVNYPLEYQNANPVTIPNDWSTIDAVLVSRKVPILVGTNLSASRAPQEGAGHVILLLGLGQDAQVKAALEKLYGQGHGDYYIVADPAGHYYADPNNFPHYGQVATLIQQCVGINQGGWFAIYPKGELQKRISAGGKKGVLQVLSFYSSSNIVTIVVHSPVAPIVTDPLGRRTGVQPDGTIFTEIPQSYFVPEVADVEEEPAASSILPLGPKSIVLTAPQSGLYQVDLVGLDSGAFTLDWTRVSASGVILESKTQTGMASPGEHNTFVFQVPNTSGTSADLSLTKSAPPTAAVGDRVTYSVTILNNGPNDATNVNVIDQLPGSATFAAAFPSQGSCNSGQTVSCNLGALTKGQSATLTIDVTFSKDGMYTNTAVVGANESDPDSTNNSSSVTTNVTQSTGQATVPNVAGLSQASAQTIITGAGLTVGTVTMASNASVPTGSVISQNPTAGTSVASGTAVNLVISTGPVLVTVPNVVSLTQADAQMAISAAGLTPGTVTNANSATVPAGSVISQNPAGGTSVATGSAVALVISSGPATVLVPNVVGVTQSAAQTAITGGSLVVGTITMANSATVPVGLVISQNPIAGTSAASGSAVNLVISSGPATVVVPNVVGLIQAAAQTTITGASLIVGTMTSANSSVVPAGVVISQNPVSGTSVTPGSAVAFVVSLGTLIGDLNGDGVIDLSDLNLITAVLNTPASGPDDPRDLNHDGVINALDARILVTMCTRPRCATQ